MHMFASAPLTVGQRLKIRRRQRGLPRRVVANLVGRSEEWLRLIESGQRTLNNIEVLARLAAVLRIDDPAELIDWPTARTAPFQLDPDDDLRALRRILVDHPAIRAPGEGATEAYDIAALESELFECQQIWASSPQRYSRLTAILPAVLNRVRTARWHRQDIETAELLADAYHLTRSLLSACGDRALAGTVADRALSTAAHTRRPLLVAASAWHMAIELLRSHSPIAGHDFALAAAQRIVDLAPVTVEAATLSGALHLAAAHAAAAAGDLRESVELLSSARRAADELGIDHRTRGISFGPIEIGITELEIALAQHDPDRAIKLAPAVEPTEKQALERRAAYHLCQARAYVLRCDTTATTLALMQAAAVSPEDLHYNVDAHSCLQYVTQHDNHLIRAELDHLVKLAGATA